MKIYRNWSPNDMVKKLQSEGKMHLLLSSIKESLSRQTKISSGAIAVAVCGDENVLAVKRLGFNTVWVAFPTEKDGEFVFYPSDSVEAGLSVDEVKSVRHKVNKTVFELIEKEGFQEWA